MRQHEVGNTTPGTCSTAVPPRRAVLDNGASTDSAALAHSTANLTRSDRRSHLGGSHRKFAAYQTVVADPAGTLGSTCDSILTGGQTHGNVVAGTILATPASSLPVRDEHRGRQPGARRI